MITSVKIRPAENDILNLEEIKIYGKITAGRSAAYGAALEFVLRHPPKSWEEVRSIQLEPLEKAGDEPLSIPQVLSLNVDADLYQQVVNSFRREYTGRISQKFMFHCVVTYYLNCQRNGFTLREEEDALPGGQVLMGELLELLRAGEENREDAARLLSGFHREFLRWKGKAVE
ncbi:hypothetical protein AALA54_09225 [Oscillospiraceae bacterium 44-34]